MTTEHTAESDEGWPTRDVPDDAAFLVPSVEWLAQALCGWHDAELGRLPGDLFPCGHCKAQAEHVAEYAEPTRRG